MKNNRGLFYCLMVGIVGCFSGCGRLVDLAKETVPQSAAYKQDKKIVKHYLKSIRLYDEFQMIAMFDALWLSDDIRTMHAQHYSLMRGATHDTTEAIRRQLQANEKTITFYVLSLRAHPLHISNPSWIVYLDVDGHCYQPQEIKFVELLPYYISLLEKSYSIHKQACEVKFSRIDEEGNDILKSKCMSLHFSNQKYYGQVSWDLAQKIVDKKDAHG